MIYDFLIFEKELYIYKLKMDKMVKDRENQINSKRQNYLKNKTLIKIRRDKKNTPDKY